MQKWFFVAGEGSFPEATKELIPEEKDIPDMEDKECIILYEECNFKGQSSRICSDAPYTDIDYEVLSIKIPDGKNAYLYNMPVFNGKSAFFKESKECLKNVDFKNAQKYDIKLLSEEVMFNDMPGSMHIKYKKPQLRKNKGLKIFQRE